MVKRCSFCILPTNIPNLTLDKNGKCNYCRESETSHVDESQLSNDRTKERFEAIIERLRGKGKYDCLVPLSGGKESCYILSVLVKKYKLRPLAFNFNNSFQHKDAIYNIENLVDKLGVDLIVYRPRKDMMLKLFRTFLSNAGEFCTPCNMLINSTSFRFARDNKIRLIMSGNYEKIDPGLEGLSPSRYYDRRYYFNVTKDLLRPAERENYVVPSYIKTAIGRLIGSAPQAVNVLEFINPSLGEIHDVLSEIGWKQPGGAIQHGDCLINPVKEYLIYRKWGCTEKTALYSSLVRNGEISREEALQKEAADIEKYAEKPSVLPEFLERLGVTEYEFNEAVKRDFTKIPNMRGSFFFKYAKKIVQKISQIRGLI